MENSEKEKSYDEESDLGAVIDNRLQVGTTAGKIKAAQLMLGVVIRLLVDNEVISAPELIEKFKEREQKFIKDIEEVTATVTEPDDKSLADVQRFLTALKEQFDGAYKQFGDTGVSEKDIS